MLGFFTAIIYERATDRSAPPSDQVSLATESDLPVLQQLTASGIEHPTRLRHGDVCLFSTIDGYPAGVLWLNLEGHTDQYLGRWSKPSAAVAYYNQLQVDPRHRRRGVARALVQAALYESAQRGRTTMRAGVLQENRASLRLHRALDFRPIAIVRGARAGRMTVRIPNLHRAGRPPR